jgi:protein DGCR14
MTWGEIEGTPFRLDGSDTPFRNPLSTPTAGPQFKIPEVPNRDKIGLQLAEKASKAHRDKKQQAMQRAKSNFAS